MTGAQAQAYAEVLAAEGVVAEAEAIAAATAGGSTLDGSALLPSTTKVTVVAFGSLHSDGRSDPQPLAGVTIIAFPGRPWHEWWSALTGGDFDKGSLPGNLDTTIGLYAGAQFHADEQQVLRTPGAVVSTTGTDGTAVMWLNPGRSYHLCVLSPDAEGLIAGCEYDFRSDTHYSNSPGGLIPDVHGAAMVYFSRGRAYLGAVRDVGDDTSTLWLNRSYWFQQIAESVFGSDLTAPAARPAPSPKPQPGEATVDFYSGLNIHRGDMMALVEDSQIGAWWDTIHTATIDKPGSPLDAATLESLPAILVPLQPDPTVYEDFLANVTVDAGVYLVCWLYSKSPIDGVERYTLDLCTYEELPAGSHSYLNLGYLENFRYLTNNRGYDPQQ